MSNKILEVRGLSKNFGALKAVDELELDVYKGDVFGFLGPNGAGKSTSLRMLLDLIKPDKGEIKFFGLDLNKHRNEILSRVGGIVERPDFYRYLSGKRNLEIFSKVSLNIIKKNRIDELIEFVGLTGRGDEPVKAYSQGMKQRLGIAQALLHDPELIILDEPTNGLDPQGILDIRRLIRHLSNDLKKTIILSSHILSETELIVNRLAVLNKGKLAAQGTLKELMHDQDAFVIIHTPESKKADYIIQQTEFVNSIRMVANDSIEMQLHLNDIPKVNALLVQNNIPVTGIESRRQLEEFFFRITESAERMKL